MVNSRVFKVYLFVSKKINFKSNYKQQPNVRNRENWVPVIVSITLLTNSFENFCIEGRFEDLNNYAYKQCAGMFMNYRR